MKARSIHSRCGPLPRWCWRSALPRSPSPRSQIWQPRQAQQPLRHSNTDDSYVVDVWGQARFGTDDCIKAFDGPDADSCPPV